MVQWLTNPTRNREVVGSIPVLAVAVSCGVGCRRGSDLVLLWLWRRLAAVAPIGPLTWELHVPRERPKKWQNDKKKEKKKN